MHRYGIGYIRTFRRILFEDRTRFGGIGFILRRGDDDERPRRSGKERLQFHAHRVDIFSDIIFHVVDDDAAAYDERNVAESFSDRSSRRILFEDRSLVARRFRIAQLDFRVQFFRLHFDKRRRQFFPRNIGNEYLFGTFYVYAKDGQACKRHHDKGDDDGR